MMRNTVTLADFKLRLFIDTNVLIDYIENFDENNCVTFINFFQKSRVRKKSKIENVELVTSDYVLWEFKGRVREELYAQMLVNDYGYSLTSANKICKEGKFRKHADGDCMAQFGKKISEYEKSIFDDNNKLVYLVRLIGQPYKGLSQTIDAILECSKFSYKDAIVLASAYFTKSHSLITCDEQDFNKTRLEQLQKSMKEWQHFIHRKLDIIRPCMFPNIRSLRQEYKKWFMENNRRKIIGTVRKYYSRLNVVEIKCKEKKYLQVGDQIWLVKFLDEKMIKIGFTIREGNLHSPKTKKPIKKGNNITVKLPYQKKNWKNAMVFLSE